MVQLVHEERAVLLGLAPLGDLALRRLVEARIVDADRRLAGDADEELLVPRCEAGRLLMAEEEPAQHLARAREDRHGKVARDRQVALRLAVIGRELAVVRILGDVVGANCRRAAEGRPEDTGVAGHGEAAELLARHPEIV